MRNRLLLVVALMILVVPAILAQQPAASQPAESQSAAQARIMAGFTRMMGFCPGLPAIDKQFPEMAAARGKMFEGMAAMMAQGGMMGQGGSGGGMGCPMGPMSQGAKQAKPAAKK